MRSRSRSRLLLVLSSMFLVTCLVLTSTAFGPHQTTRAAGSITALPLLSQNAPAFTNDSGCASASLANDSSYGTQWEGCRVPSASNPDWLAYDLSHALNGGAPGKVLVSWYNDPRSGSITTYDNPPSSYNNLGSYTIDANSAPGGGSAPTSGWMTLVSVSGNHWASRVHLLDMAGANWLRLNMTAPDGSGGAIALNLDVQDASSVPAGAPASDSWLFLGDSITLEGMNHAPREVGTFSQIISTLTSGAYYPAQLDLGLGGSDSTYGAATINSWLPLFPGQFVTLDYGTNDANGCGISNSVFKANMLSMVQAILAAGKTPVIPYIPWAPNTSVQRCAGDPNADPNVSPHLNATIKQLYSDPTYGSQIIQGPDLWTTFLNQPGLFQDSLHPNETTGYDTYRQAWGNAMLANVYNGTPPPTPTATNTAIATATPTNTGTPAPTNTPTNTPTPTDTATATPTPSPTNTPTPTPTGTPGGVTLIAIASVTAGNFGGTGIKVKLPGTVQAGDFLLAVAGGNGTPSSWTTPAGWTVGTNGGHPDGQALAWWWKIAASTDAGATITLKSSSWVDGGGVVLDYRGAAGTPIQGVSTLTTNDNGGSGHVTQATCASTSWSGTQPVVSLLLLSWQPNSATLTWPAGYSLQATANDGYGFVAVGANLTTQTGTSLASQVVQFGTSQAVIPTLQIAVLV